MAKIIHSSASNSAEFVKLSNEKIRQLNVDHLEDLNELLVQDKQETLEVLKVKQFGRRRKNDSSVIYLLCKSQKSMRKLQKLLESDELLYIFDILIDCLNSKDTPSFYRLRDSVHYRPESPRFLKRLSIDSMQFQKEVAVRQMSLEWSGEFDLPQFITALTSLDDKIYVLLGQLVSIHQDIAPFACQSKVAFPPPETTFRSHFANHRYFMVACDETKCIYIAKDKDAHLWRLTTPDYELKVWLSDIGDPFSVYVARNGNVVIMRQGDASLQAGMHHRMEIYSKDAILVHEILIPSVGLEPHWAMEISPGKLALIINNTFFVRGVNFRTLIADPDVIMFPKQLRKWRDRNISGITSYCEGQILVLLSKRLALFDSELNVDVIPTAELIDAGNVHYKKEKRQLMLWSNNYWDPPTTHVVHIYTLEYKAEDMFATDP